MRSRAEEVDGRTLTPTRPAVGRSARKSFSQCTLLLPRIIIGKHHDHEVEIQQLQALTAAFVKKG